MASLYGTDTFYGDITDGVLEMNGLKDGLPRSIEHTNGCYYDVYTNLRVTISDGLLNGRITSTVSGGYTTDDPCYPLQDCQSTTQSRALVFPPLRVGCPRR